MNKYFGIINTETIARDICILFTFVSLIAIAYAKSLTDELLYIILFLAYMGMSLELDEHKL